MVAQLKKRKILLVDPNQDDLRSTEVELRSAGFLVSTAATAEAGFSSLAEGGIELVLCETTLPDIDGFTVCRRLKADPRYTHIPFVFLTDDADTSAKMRGIEAGSDDYLARPLFLREVVTRVRMALQRAMQPTNSARSGFAGSLADMGVVDLVQTFEIGRKTGRVQLDGAKSGTLYFESGQLVDAEVGRLRGANAFYRLLAPFEGTFEVTFGPTFRERTIDIGTQALLMEGLRRLDEWGRLLEASPALEAIFELDHEKLLNLSADYTEEEQKLLRLFDGRRIVSQVVRDSDIDDLGALGVVNRAKKDGLLREKHSRSELARKPKLSIEDWLLHMGKSATRNAEAHADQSNTGAFAYPPNLKPRRTFLGQRRRDHVETTVDPSVWSRSTLPDFWPNGLPTTDPSLVDVSTLPTIADSFEKSGPTIPGMATPSTVQPLPQSAQPALFQSTLGTGNTSRDEEEDAIPRRRGPTLVFFLVVTLSLLSPFAYYLWVSLQTPGMGTVPP